MHGYCTTDNSSRKQKSLFKCDIILSRGLQIMSLELVLETLKKSDEPMKSGEIAEASKLDKKEVDKAIKKLRADGTVISPKFCYYTVAK